MPSAEPDPQPAPRAGSASYLEELTGVRSGKRSFYPAYVSSAERLERVIHAMDRISRALLRTVEGQDSLVRGTVRAAADHLSADYAVFAVRPDALPEADPRYMIIGPNGRQLHADDALPGFLRDCLGEVLQGRLDFADESGQPGNHLRVPVTLDSETVGGLLVWTHRGRAIDATDAAVLRILASQAVVALHNTSLTRRSEALLRRTEDLYSEAHQQAEQLSARNAELQSTQQQLIAARQREVVDSERHRIARELHDSVTQSVLSAGMHIEMCRSQDLAPEVGEQLDVAKGLVRGAVDQLRSVIHALNHEGESQRSSLPELLEQLSSVHLPDELSIDVRIEGQPVDLSPAAEHSLFRLAGEALFNSALHGHAGRALIRLAYRPEKLALSVSDDGCGSPETLRKALRVACARDLDGSHRGLANMQARAAELGGALTVRRSRMGGVEVHATVPLPLPEPEAAHG